MVSLETLPVSKNQSKVCGLLPDSVLINAPWYEVAVDLIESISTKIRSLELEIIFTDIYQ